MRYECSYGPTAVKPSTMARKSAGGTTEAAPGNGDKCGCRYCFTVFQYKDNPTLALIERPVRPHSGHTAKTCRWISEDGRTAVREAFFQGIRGCAGLRAALRASIAARIGLGNEETLEEKHIDLICDERPDLVRDYQATSQDVMYVVARPRRAWVLNHFDSGFITRLRNSRVPLSRLQQYHEGSSGVVQA